MRRRCGRCASRILRRMSRRRFSSPCTARPARLRSRPTLAGWLITVTRYAAVDAMRKQMRLKERERAAARSVVVTGPEQSSLDRVEPMIDAALQHLRARDRDAVVLRFFEDKSFPQIGRTMGMSEEAARKRVNRGVQKLRKHFERQGVTLSAAAFTSIMAGSAITAAPTTVAASLSTLSVTAPPAAALSIAKGAIVMMTLAKAKLIRSCCRHRAAVGRRGSGRVDSTRGPGNNSDFPL